MGNEGLGAITRPPKRVLLATDLSPRCDRALDRAAALVAEWSAKLVVVHVIEPPGVEEAADLHRPSWRQPPDRATLARRQMVLDIGEVGAAATIVIEEGDPAEAILRVAKAEECDLVITGIARGELFGRFFLGSTVDRLLRRSPVPVLVVRNRVRGRYRHIVAATDFSSPSRRATEAAAAFFPGRRLTLFHACDLRAPSAVMDAPALREECRKFASQESKAFLENMAKPEGWVQPALLAEEGAPEYLLQDYSRDHDLDLVVLGTHGRGAVLGTLFGSVAKRIVDVLPADALVVGRGGDG